MAAKKTTTRKTRPKTERAADLITSMNIQELHDFGTSLASTHPMVADALANMLVPDEGEALTSDEIG